MIRFKYRPNDGIMQLIAQTVPDITLNGYIDGMLQEESRYQLKNLSVYLVCSVEEINSRHIYRDPTAVVAKNDYEAIEIFANDVGKPGSVMCTLEDKANKMKVLPV